MQEKLPHTIERPPIVVIMGHIDHGKSTLLDYIRRSNVVASEAGGITQHMSAYEVVHAPTPAGAGSGSRPQASGKKITFLDTPGHAAFSSMRSRGATVADIAILVVSAEDGVKLQTLEALTAIEEAKLPYIVAITKIDKENANIERVKQDLATHNIFLEGYGGSVPCVPVSGKTGAGISELLDMLLLVAELGEYTADTARSACGSVIETSRDSRRGTSATLVIQDGTLHRGDLVLLDGCITPVRLLEDYAGASIAEATVSAPVRIVGCTSEPAVGSQFQAFATRKLAEAALEQIATTTAVASERRLIRTVEIPIILKSDVAGTLEAIQTELAKLATEEVGIHVVQSGVGPISETDVKVASGTLTPPLIIGFHVKPEKSAQAYALQMGLTIHSFDVIYDIIKLLEAEIELRRPRVQTEEVLGRVKILKVFNRAKDKQVVGGTVFEGKMTDQGQVKLMRHEHEIGRGRIVELQAHKLKVKEVESGNQCGVLVDAKMTIAPGDILEAFILVTK